MRAQKKRKWYIYIRLWLTLLLFLHCLPPRPAFHTPSSFFPSSIHLSSRSHPKLPELAAPLIPSESPGVCASALTRCQPLFCSPNGLCSACITTHRRTVLAPVPRNVSDSTGTLSIYYSYFHFITLFLDQCIVAANYEWCLILANVII